MNATDSVTKERTLQSGEQLLRVARVRADAGRHVWCMHQLRESLMLRETARRCRRRRAFAHN